MDHIDETVNKVMIQTITKALDNISGVLKTHNDMIKDCVKGIDALYQRIDALEKEISHEM